MEISVLEQGETAGEPEIWEGGGHGDGQVFAFCGAVGGTPTRAVTLFNKMPRKARGREGGEGETQRLGLAGDCQEMKVALRPLLSSLSTVSTF